VDRQVGDEVVGAHAFDITERPAVACAPCS
jgi:hypothetical protein